MVGKYRLTKETLGITIATHLAESVPKGTVVDIRTAPLAGDRTVVVYGKGKPMVMFVRDLAERADRLAHE
jgi:hypothetical protein